MNRALIVFAQMTTTSQGKSGEQMPTVRHLLLLLIIVILAFVLTGVVVYWYRRRLLGESANQPDASLTLSDVRALHRTGQIDDAEKERLKTLVLDEYRETFDLSESPAQRDEPEDEGASREEQDTRKTEAPSDDAEDSEDHEDE